jgi:hypothetical protein
LMPVPPMSIERVTGRAVDRADFGEEADLAVINFEL